MPPNSCGDGMVLQCTLLLGESMPPLRQEWEDQWHLPCLQYPYTLLSTLEQVAGRIKSTKCVPASMLTGKFFAWMFRILTGSYPSIAARKNCHSSVRLQGIQHKVSTHHPSTSPSLALKLSRSPVLSFSVCSLTIPWLGPTTSTMLSRKCLEM